MAFEINEFCNDPIKMYQQDAFTIPVNLAELPALSMPIGFAHDMPVGMQVIGQKWHEKFSTAHISSKPLLTGTYAFQNGL